MEEEKKKINKMNKGLEVGIEGGNQDEEKDVVMKPEKILSVRKKMKLKQKERLIARRKNFKKKIKK